MKHDRKECEDVRKLTHDEALEALREDVTEQNGAQPEEERGVKPVGKDPAPVPPLEWDF